MPNQIELFERIHKKANGIGEWCDGRVERIAYEHQGKIKDEHTHKFKKVDGCEQCSRIPFELFERRTKHQQRSPSESPRDRYGVTQRNAPDRQMLRKETAERPTESRKASSLSGNLPPLPPLLKGQRTPSKERSPIPRKRQTETMNSKDQVDRVELEEKAFSRPRKDRCGNKNSVNAAKIFYQVKGNGSPKKDTKLTGLIRKH
nr:hypothetical protein [Tanacetum cinerariifolium]